MSMRCVAELASLRASLRGRREMAMVELRVVEWADAKRASRPCRFSGCTDGKGGDDITRGSKLSPGSGEDMTRVPGSPHWLAKSRPVSASLECAAAEDQRIQTITKTKQTTKPSAAPHNACTRPRAPSSVGETRGSSTQPRPHLRRTLLYTTSYLTRYGLPCPYL